MARPNHGRVYGRALVVMSPRHSIGPTGAIPLPLIVTALALSIFAGPVSRSAPGRDVPQVSFIVSRPDTSSDVTVRRRTPFWLHRQQGQLPDTLFRPTAYAKHRPPRQMQADASAAA